ncbi:DUF4363 family protein [Agathobaculum sp.]|uniref:DUF4363 family protein n=1 Tax=Agathobaculum sp. TaxID=2048138 RepID=UPI002A7FB5F7|nr:DUF4363 family protein [Agathobaculum sp.]MDY3618669.1 DUF4363 family protein [Agathobaculum sp.]
MRRPLIALILLAVLLAGCVWSDRSLERVVGQIEQAVQQDDLDSAQKQWSEAQSLFGALLMHEELDQTDRLFARAIKARDVGEDRELAIERAELLSQLAHLPELDEASIKNVF